jgi:conjugative transfer pilus assembly protein TraH
MRFLRFFFFFFVTWSAEASMDKELDNFFQSFGGGGVNYTKGGVYNDQSGGFYTGGRLYARTPAKNISFANVQAPSFKAGCGGIDLYMGGLSFINAQDFMKASRHIMSNALGYAASLSLQTMAPQVYNTMHKLNDIARDINNMNISSCEASATLLAGAWPKSDASSRYLCNIMGTKDKSVFEDWAQSRQGCGVEGKRSSVNSGKNGEFKDVLGDEFNLTWKAIRKNGFLVSDDELAEVFMSISGTIISKRVGSDETSGLKQVHLASLANDQDLIDALLYGGSNANIYGCDAYDEDKCLNPKKKPFTIAGDKGLVTRVEDLLQSIASKSRTYDAKGLTEQEKGLIESTRIPILKIIIVQNAYKAGNPVINVTEFSEGIAYDLLLQFMEQTLDLVTQSLKELEKVQIDGQMISEFKQDIREARKLVLERRNGIYQQMHTALSVIQKTKLMEAQLQHNFSSYTNLEE